METHLHFNSQYLPKPSGEYIAWCDGMGTGRSLMRSLHQAANFVFKLHTAFSIAQSQVPGCRCYPMMDGIYVCTPCRATMMAVLRRAFCELAREFINKPKVTHVFMVRGGLAFGPTLHGQDIDERAFYGTYHGYTTTPEMFHQSPLSHTRSQVVLSPAMVLAYKAEGSAPPFGIFVDDSAQCYPQLSDDGDGGFRGKLLHWWGRDEEARQIVLQLHTQIQYYLDICEQNATNLAYPRESIARHRELAEGYFGNLSDGLTESQPDASGDG